MPLPPARPLTPHAAELVERLRQAGNPDDAAAKAAYLQATPGGYGEGDLFLGVRVPAIRQIARAKGSLEDATSLLTNEFHEARLLGVILLVNLVKPKRTSPKLRADVANVVLRYVEYLNNWDLIDTAAGPIVGTWLATLPTTEQDAVLDKLATAPLLWRRRLAMVSTQGLMRAGDTRQVFRLAERLLHAEEDLMHKAVGWMLREAGQLAPEALDAFLTQHAATMPRTALRYALEKHSPTARAHFMHLGR